jgi:hypothetical protein
MSAISWKYKVHALDWILVTVSMFQHTELRNMSPGRGYGVPLDGGFQVMKQNAWQWTVVDSVFCFVRSLHSKDRYVLFEKQ